MRGLIAGGQNQSKEKGITRRRDAMKSRNTSIFTAAAILLILSNSAFAYRQVIDLGPLNNYYTQATSINDNGHVVGGGATACLFDSSGGWANKNLGVLGSGDASRALSINNSGQIVGYAYNRPGVATGTWYARACLFDSTGHGANKDLGTLGGTTSVAYSINNNGQIVGEADNSSNFSRACLFDSTGRGANINLGSGYAYSINNNGRIVGSSSGGAVIFDSTGGGANINLGTGTAYSINNNGQIVGSSGSGIACIYDPTGGKANISLGALGGSWSSANSINDLGQIAGYAYNGSGNQRACLFDPTGHGNNIDLNTLIAPSSGWVLTNATCINNNGWIAGYGTHNGNYFGFVLTPEPATLLLFTLGGLALRRKR
jgi:uncharacterized membrane protein